jgi:NitT/TauT family transport system ATP-binding protein
MTVLALDGVGHAYGGVPAVAEVSLATRPGELLCIVGPSGCGKTTLLRCVSGLTVPTSGTVEIDGRRVTGPPRSLALVFQDYGRSLLPWMTVHANVALPLKARRVPRARRDAAARTALAAVDLAGQGDKYPWQLSGGMQQRAAIARALAYEPEVLLLDEPFASVDAQTRADLEDLLLEVWARTGLTVLLVTHDIDEAVYLADRIIVLSAGPARVKETIDVDLPRPRDQISTKELPAFAHLRARVFASIKAERPPPRGDHGEDATWSGPAGGTAAGPGDAGTGADDATAGPGAVASGAAERVPGAGAGGDAAGADHGDDVGSVRR